MPAIYPGFSWNHQKKITDAETSSTKVRRKGQFFWEQWCGLKRLNVDTAFLAMFDEVDEGTAIYKCETIRLCSTTESRWISSPL